MGLVAAKCTQCGANIEIDETKGAGICQYCGTAFVSEKILNNYYTVASTVNIYKKPTENEFETNGRRLIVYKGLNEVVYIPEYITEINNDAFRDNKKIKKVIVPDSVKIIGDRAFFNCENLEEIELPNSMFSFGNYGIFLGCKALKKVKIPNDIGFIGQSMFEGCVCLEEVKIPESVHTIKESAFAHCTSLKNIIIPSSIKIMGWLVFSYCNLYSITFENEKSIEEMGRGIFYKSQKMPQIIASDIFISKYKNEFDLEKSVLDDKAYGVSGGCYIATCVYGTYDCPQVWTLRRFRDYTLDETWFGRLFIKCYYAISPAIVKWFGATKWFRRFWRARLDKMVSYLNNKGVDNTCYHDKY